MLAAALAAASFVSASFAAGASASAAETRRCAVGSATSALRVAADGLRSALLKGGEASSEAQEEDASALPRSSGGPWPWLAPKAWPLPSAELHRALLSAAALRGSGGAAAEEGLLCEEGALLHLLLQAYGSLAGSLRDWNTTALTLGDAGAQRTAMSDVFVAYNHFLAYQSRKAALVRRFPGERDLLDSWHFDEWEELVGLVLRSAWLSMAPQQRLQQSQCACRDTPETNSLLFDAFDELRGGGRPRSGFGLFQCNALDLEPDFSDWNTLLADALQPSAFQCIPLYIVIRAACAVRAFQEGKSWEGRRLLDAAANLLALAADCFDHTPWTSPARRGTDWPASLSSAEVFFNRAQKDSAGPQSPSEWTWERN
ncbi:unnamed protein product [Polarella glacialis]|uniref:Uncharacterized protein n=1 Tax=Polarella glacialis TaxID=89957 RepID=A0A813JL28_POLGL|nr:unnamed protein product [Polarella glacialis]